MSDKCNQEVFENGKPLLLVDTGEVGGAAVFELWVQGVARDSGQPVDWHYSGGIAQVLALGDWNKAQDAARCAVMPTGMRVMRWCESDADGAYRAGVTEAPDGMLGAYLDPITGKQVFMVESASTSTDQAETQAAPDQ
jgi:hypothetical protein